MEGTLRVPAAEGCFRFQLEGDESGKVWELPLITKLPYRTMNKLVKRIRESSETQGFTALDDVDAILDDLAPGLLDRIDADQYRFIIGAWSDASGMTPGESQGSPGTSPATATP